MDSLNKFINFLCPSIFCKSLCRITLFFPLMIGGIRYCNHVRLDFISGKILAINFYFFHRYSSIEPIYFFLSVLWFFYLLRNLNVVAYLFS
jgi:hypothetical protein